MSSRQLRKLQQQRELEQAKQAKSQADREAPEESDEEPVVLLQKPKASLFASFAALEDAEEDDVESAEEKPEAKYDSSEPEPAPSVAQKKPKKSKKKKKGKSNEKEVAKPAEAPDTQDGPDEIDAALAALKLKAPAGQSQSDVIRANIDPEYERVCQLLGVNTHNLKVANEMRNLFGRDATDDNEDAGGAVPRGARRHRGRTQQVDLETALKGHHAPGKGLPEITLRRNIFIQGKDDWPRANTGGLKMDIVQDGPGPQRGNGIIEFRFVHDQSYQRVQEQFDIFVEMGDPQNLIGLLQRNPYHVSLLLQVSKIAKDQSDHALSSDLLERALFTFARASTSLFATKLSQGKAFLDFRRPENRELWLAGYQYIKSLTMKGTYRTAFEWAKLLYSLDPKGDPYSLVLVLHHLALRGHAFQWLLEFSSTLDTSQRASHTYPSLAFAALQLRDGVKCRTLLEESMQTLPWLFCSLFKELNLDAPPPIWGSVPRTDAEILFTEIYVRQTKSLWDTPEATSLLMEIAHAIEKVDETKIQRVENQAITLDVVRFVYLDNTPELMAMVPSTLLHRSNNSDADPLPPDENIFSYESQRMHVGRGQDAHGVQGDFFDPIAALARLVNLPGFAPAFDRMERQGDEGEDDEIERAELRRQANPGFEIEGEPGDEHASERDELRRQLEHQVAREDEQRATRDGSEPGDELPRVSFARRVLDMFWGPAALGDESESVSEHTDTDSDEEVPRLENTS